MTEPTLTAKEPFDLVIFDCDGVLVDSETISAATLAQNLSQLGLVTDIDYVMEHYLGRSFSAIEADFFHRSGKPIPADFASNWHDNLFDAFRRDLKPIDGIHDVLGRLAIRKCAASSSAPSRLALSLEVTGLAEAFRPHIFDASMVKRGKPAPDLYLYCADRMGIDPGRSLVVEDSVAGVLAGVAAGMTVWGFIGGAHFAPGDNGVRLQSAGASRIFRSMAEFAIG